MTVCALINLLHGTRRPGAPVVIDTKTCKCDFDEVTAIVVDDAVYLKGER